MNYRIAFITGFVLLALFGCTYEAMQPSKEIPQPSIDYLIFGHTGSFCLNCDALYKIENGKLYGANHQMISNPDNVHFKLFPDSSFKLVRSLSSEIPTLLTAGSTTTIQSIGSYVPDVGHYYIEVGQHQKIHRWYIEAFNNPNYLTDFVNDINTAMDKLK